MFKVHKACRANVSPYKTPASMWKKSMLPSGERTIAFVAVTVSRGRWGALKEQRILFIYHLE